MRGNAILGPQTIPRPCSEEQGCLTRSSWERAVPPHDPIACHPGMHLHI
jgi:hypothetical protein